MNNQFIRKIGLFLQGNNKVVDLSQFHIQFNVKSADWESPNTAVIRVYNLKKETLYLVQNNGEFNEVILNAGYESGNYGVIFQGTICQFYIGRENATDTFLEIRASDGDIFYNQGFVNLTLAAGHDFADKIKAIDEQIGSNSNITALLSTQQHVVSARGSTLLGMARAQYRNIASTLDASWSIQNGEIVFKDNTGYKIGEVVNINAQTGMIGIPEQTPEGIQIKCLLNSRLRLGGLIHLNNDDLNQLRQRDPNTAAILPYNQWAGLYNNAPLTESGYYEVFAIDHEGDTRGNHWESKLVCLATNITLPADQSVSPL